MRRLTLAGLAVSCALAVAGPAHAEGRAPFVLAAADDWELRAHLEAGINLVAERDLFWQFAQSVAGNTDFDSNAEWLEISVKPGLAFHRELDPQTRFYGGASAVVSGTAGTDAFDAGDTGRATIEELYLGWSRRAESGAGFDASFGAREWKAGTGMLLANGGSSGFSRGALKLGPRRAWRVAGLATASTGRLSGTAFYLDPNESPDNDTGTHMAGVDLRYDADGGTYAGLTAGEVMHSTALYPQAAPGGIGPPRFLEGGRDGLRFLTAYALVKPAAGPFGNAWFGLDLALERNRRIDLRAWAARAQAGYTFADRSWRPSIAYVYQTFSGDDPDTPRLERFDPLYYEGNPSAWSTGSKSSMVFINANVNAHQLVLSVAPTPRDTITFRLARISANELRSPIQFGQATRVEIQDGIANPITGVTRHHLSDDFYIELQRVVTPNVYFTAGFSVSRPGVGIDSIVPSVDAPLWSGGFANLIVNY